MNVFTFTMLMMVAGSGANEIEIYQINPDGGFVIYKMEPEAHRRFKYLQILFGKNGGKCNKT